ncbi:MAG: FkbM family methyltransferase [Pseudomonadota bacterium]
MSNQLSSWVKKKLLKKEQNLLSLNEPYSVIEKLLKTTTVTGILDAGGSNGRISKVLLKSFPKAKAYAFEPNPMYKEQLENYAREDARFHPQYMALSDHEGSADLFITESPGNTSLLTPGERLKEIDPQGAGVKERRSVEIVTIDEWAKRNNDLAIQVMKFDIQGAELQALHGGMEVLRRSTCAVYIEVWFNTPYQNGALYSEIDLFFRKLDFILYDLFKPKYSKNGLIMWANALYVDPAKIKV